MTEFPKELKPIFVENEDLIRLGSIDDGGYVVPINTVKSSNSLISFGISDNWDFERDFLKRSSANVFAYDNSINNNFWISKFKKDLIKFLKLNKKNKFFLESIGNSADCLSLNQIIKDHFFNEECLFLKIDIEGFEYEILDDIINHKNKIQGIVIEFHEVTKNLNKIKDFIEKLNPELYLVHLHGNNYSIKDKDQFPQAIELTFSKNKLHSIDKKNNKVYPLANLDYPNSKRSPDIKITFND